MGRVKDVTRLSELASVMNVNTNGIPKEICSPTIIVDWVWIKDIDYRVSSYALIGWLRCESGPFLLNRGTGCLIVLHCQAIIINSRD
ncbi:hypothetical protein EEL33_08710 [Muribaculaceae bacterium Isolate-037 (Harlan)]|nr:hypothetical protein EEL33_08710 [Muribaculaceae bacterium Isolate-037 (Harlan)]